MADRTGEEYWQRYSNLQHIKHELIRRYLGGWFPKLGWAGRVVYLETHAGRGRHATGEAGSPLVALNTLLGHSFGERLLRTCQFEFVFIERDDSARQELEREVAALNPLPPSVNVSVLAGDAFDTLKALVRSLRQGNQQMAPAFVFVDPYGFAVPAEVLAEVMAAGRVELFVNVMWRELDMALAQQPGASGLTDTLDRVFGGTVWRDVPRDVDASERAEHYVRSLAQAYGAKWWTSMRMLGENGATRYLLVHFTNHPAGRDLMKDCMWSVAPHGGFYASKSEDPRQQWLIEPEPNLRQLAAWLVAQLETHPLRWSALSERLRSEIWKDSHLAQVIKELRQDGKVTGSDFTGTFSRKADPLLSLSGTP